MPEVEVENPTSPAPTAEQKGDQRLPLPGEPQTRGEPSQQERLPSETPAEQDRLMPEKPETLPEIVEGQPVPEPDRPSKTKQVPPVTQPEEILEDNEQ